MEPIDTVVDIERSHGGRWTMRSDDPGMERRGVRIVVAGDEARRAVVSRDEILDGVRLESFPGAAFFHVWSGDSSSPLRDCPNPPRWIPRPGRFRFGVSVLPASYGGGRGTTLDLDEIRMGLPGLAEALDPDVPGMHATDTLDLVYVAAGTVALVLDGNDERILSAGDCVVQRGNRHAWRNDGPNTCVLVITMLGAPRVEASP